MALSRPWILLFRDPVVFLHSIYTAIIYGTLYMLFLNFPIIYQEARGWNENIGRCAFLGALVGMLSTVVYMIIHNPRYNKAAKQREDRFPPTMLVSVLIPIEMFWFAWINYPSI